ncbi:MDR family MFS transporter [Microbacterium sp. MPKO10]|uniref:MDR family MFS transporter n=1 Tax=Microbacterium sp. MPKO10 TaxID=2989818 RepID=UPI002236AE35|nr:MDR family MFS transporter [Microbacterium sp. MPKO10]MCW4456642.1 multidrug efflux MFS transporter [Microbacterium sp. MPKO10]
MSAEKTRTPLDRGVLIIAIVTLVGGIAVILDSTIVSVALRDLASDLDASIATIQWVSTGYLLALGVAIPLVGWLQKRLGAKRLWLAGLAVFLLGSLLSACAWGVTSLIVFRVVQGLGGGVMLPLMVTIVMQAAKGENLGKLMATVSLPAALGPILGPVIGGLLMSTGDWRWLFLVNLPVGVIGLVLAWRVLPADHHGAERARLDFVGLLLLAPALVGLLWGLANVPKDGGLLRVDAIVPIGAGLALLIGFAFWAAGRGAKSLVDVRVLKHRQTWSATALLFLSGAALYGALVLLPLFWQDIRGADALGAGILLIPQGVGALLSRFAAAQLTERFGARTVSIVGFAVVGASTLPFAFADADTSLWVLLAALFVRGFGLSAVTMPLMTVAYVGLVHDEIPHASILTRIAQQIGGAVGVALLTVILQSVAQTASSPARAFDVAFWWACGFAAVAVVLSVVLPGKNLGRTTENDAQTERSVVSS